MNSNTQRFFLLASTLIAPACGIGESRTYTDADGFVNADASGTSTDPNWALRPLSLNKGTRIAHTGNDFISAAPDQQFMVYTFEANLTAAAALCWDFNTRMPTMLNQGVAYELDMDATVYANKVSPTANTLCATPGQRNTIRFVFQMPRWKFVKSVAMPFPFAETTVEYEMGTVSFKVDENAGKSSVMSTQYTAINP